MLGAVCTGDGTTGFEIALAAPLPLVRPDDPIAWFVEAGRVLDVVDAVIAACAPFGRAADLVTTQGAERVWNDLALPIEAVRLRASARESVPAVGVHRQRDRSRVWIGVVPALGRLQPRVLRALAELAERHAGAELRVTPWRGVVLPHVAASDAEIVTAACGRLGLVSDPSHPVNTVVACAGSTGCPAGLADTQADAQAVVDRLTAVPESRRPRSIHVSGCDKGCARPRPAEVSLVAGPDPGTYDLYDDDAEDANTPRFGRRVASGLELGDAVDRLVTPEGA